MNSWLLWILECSLFAIIVLIIEFLIGKLFSLFGEKEKKWYLKNKKKFSFINYLIIFILVLYFG